MGGGWRDFVPVGGGTSFSKPQEQFAIVHIHMLTAISILVDYDRLTILPSLLSIKSFVTSVFFSDYTKIFALY